MTVLRREDNRTMTTTETKVCPTDFIGRIFFDNPTGVRISIYKNNLLEMERITIEFQILKFLQLYVYKYKYINMYIHARVHWGHFNAYFNELYAT
jgi:hypothetical protein